MNRKNKPRANRGLALGKYAPLAGKAVAMVFFLLDSAPALAGCELSLVSDNAYNNCIGTNALAQNLSGYDNVAMGIYSLFSNTEGHDNTALGVMSMYSNATGSFNTATGAYALWANSFGMRNAAVGADSLRNNTTGSENSAVGSDSLRGNSTGFENSALGQGALFSNTAGYKNTAAGKYALFGNSTGFENTAAGQWALASNSTGSQNTAIGAYALMSNSGSKNIALGFAAGKRLTNGANNIAIGNHGVEADSGTIRLGTSGTHGKIFIAGIRGVAVSSGAAVLVNAKGQLGVASSSRDMKESIEPIGDSSSSLMRLRPVRFHYKEPDEAGRKPVQYGLIAEEVAQVMPELAVPNEQGKPETVAYHALPSLLLNEYQKQQKELLAVQQRLNHAESQLREVRGEVASLRASLAMHPAPTLEMKLAGADAFRERKSLGPFEIP